MKIQVCTALVMMAAVLVGAAYGKHPAQGIDSTQYELNFLINVTSDLCGETLCHPQSDACWRHMKRTIITTEQELIEIRTNLTKCAETIGATNADFSTLTLEDMQHSPKNEDRIITFMKKFKVGDRSQQYALIKCILERTGELPTLRACLAATKTDTADEAEGETEATE